MHDWVLYFKYHVEVNYSQIIYYFRDIFSLYVFGGAQVLCPSSE